MGCEGQGITTMGVVSTINFHGDIPYYFYEFCKVCCGCFIAMLFYLTITVIFLTNSVFFNKVKNLGFLHGLLLWLLLLASGDWNL